MNKLTVYGIFFAVLSLSLNSVANNDNLSLQDLKSRVEVLQRRLSTVKSLQVAHAEKRKLVPLLARQQYLHAMNAFRKQSNACIDARSYANLYPEESTGNGGYGLAGANTYLLARACADFPVEPGFDESTFLRQVAEEYEMDELDAAEERAALNRKKIEKELEGVTQKLLAQLSE